MAKKPATSPGRTSEGELAQAIDRLTDMLSTVYDLMVRFKDDIAWIINNREDCVGVRPTPVPSATPANADPPSIEKPEIIACSDCDVPSPASLAAALDEGWTELAPHKGEHWNYVGLCPDCLESIYASEPPPRKTTAADLLDEAAADEGGAEPEHPKDTLF